MFVANVQKSGDPSVLVVVGAGQGVAHLMGDVRTSARASCHHQANTSTRVAKLPEVPRLDATVEHPIYIQAALQTDWSSRALRTDRSNLSLLARTPQMSMRTATEYLTSFLFNSVSKRVNRESSLSKHSL